MGSAPHWYRFNIYLLLHSTVTATYSSLILTIAYVLSLKGLLYRSMKSRSFTVIICTLLTEGRNFILHLFRECVYFYT